jgi:hypothetical protein
VATYSSYNGIKGVGSSYLGWGILSGVSTTLLLADSAGALEFYSDSKTNITSGSIAGTKTGSVSAAGAWTFGPSTGLTTGHTMVSSRTTASAEDSVLTVKNTANTSILLIEAPNSAGKDAKITFACPAVNYGFIAFQRSTSRLYVSSANEYSGPYIATNGTSWTTGSDLRFKGWTF